MLTQHESAGNPRAMDWNSVVAEAKDWAAKNTLGFSVSGVEEGERKISFRAPCGSFYVTVPEKIGSEEWGVWSEDDSCISSLSVDLDNLIPAQHSLEQVLEKTAVCLGKREAQLGDGGASNGGEGEEDSGSDVDDEDVDDDDDDDAYYGEDIDAAAMDVGPSQASDSKASGVSAEDFFTGQGSPAAVHRLIADLKGLSKSASKFGISGSPRDDNLFLWDVELSDFTKGSLLQKDLESYAKKLRRKPVVELEMKFPKDYPMNPPFVRIVRPRFQFLTGHVTIGGSICMQMLTRSGWSPSNDIESILVQIRAEIMSDPKARLDSSNLRTDYSELEAKDAFERMVRKYGWNK